MFYINMNVLIVLLVLNHSYNIVLKLNKTSALSGGSGEIIPFKMGFFVIGIVVGIESIVLS